jgi:hypothetical protein
MLWRHLGILPVTGSLRHSNYKKWSRTALAASFAFLIGKHTDIDISITTRTIAARSYSAGECRAPRAQPVLLKRADHW